MRQLSGMKVVVLHTKYLNVQTKESTYLADDVFAMRNRVHPGQHLQEHDSEAINIALVCQLMCQKVLGVEVSLQETVLYQKYCTET